MNKDLLNQLPADEQPVASKLNSLAEDMQPSGAFEQDLETRLMDAYENKTQSTQGWRTKLMPALGWAVLALFAVLLLNWTIRSLAPGIQPAAAETLQPEIPFADSVRQENICTGPLALAHGFNVFLTNRDKTSFVPLDTADSIGEVRSIAWSSDGKQLAVIGNTTGSGTIYITEPTSRQRTYVLSGSEIGYLWDAAWSRNGQHFVIWLSQKNAFYLLNTDGSGPVEKQVGLQILGKPQFTPDDKSIVFYGGDMTGTGLFELTLANSRLTRITPSLEDESGFSFSPDGSHLAYIEYDRDEGEAHLFAADRATGERAILGTLPIPTGSGASIPKSANLSWSADGKFLVFDFGQFASQRAIYLARADGSGLAQIVESGYAPAISSDGRCLAYINNKQVFLLDLAEVPSTAAPVLLADLPAGRNTLDLDKLQWKPGTSP
jgi:dipeptidyl aminopeptidase/acylaminoacyl peptidase